MLPNKRNRRSEAVPQFPKVEKRRLVGLAIILIEILLLGIAILVIQDARELDADALKLYSKQIVSVDDNYTTAQALMMYTHDNIPGTCVEKSFMFERLARAQGLETRHIALVNRTDNYSHATTQILIDGEWRFFDSYYGHEYRLKDYQDMGYGQALIHLNCIDGNCSNYSKLTFILTWLWTTREVRA